MTVDASIHHFPYESMASSSREKTIQVTVKRWGILAMYSLLILTSSFQINQYIIVTDIVDDFYNKPPIWTQWTANMVSAFYFVLILPADWILEKFGLRWTVLTAAVLNAISSWIKIATYDHTKSYLVILSQVIACIGQVFILGLPPRIASVWFSANELSTACALGVLAYQAGFALAGIIPALVIPSAEGNVTMNNITNLHELENGFLYLNSGSAALCTVALIVCIFFFSNKPSTPPSHAQAEAEDAQDTIPYFFALRTLFRNRNFVLLFLSYGVLVGAFYAYSNIFNQLLVPYMKMDNRDTLISLMWVTVVVSGMVGSIIAGLWLDKTHTYKWTSVTIYGMAALSMFAFSFVVIYVQKVYANFIITALLGFFMCGYLPVGFEFGAEVSYPISEGTTGNLLYMSGNLLAVLITIILGYFLMETGLVLVTSLVLAGLLSLGTVLTAFVGNDLRRLKKEIN